MTYAIGYLTLAVFFLAVWAAAKRKERQLRKQELARIEEMQRPDNVVRFHRRAS